MLVQAETPAAEVSTETVVTPAVVETPAAVAPVRPEGLADSYWDDAVGVKPEAFTRLAELEAADAARAEGVPADGKYVFELPADLVDLNGQPLKIDAADPLAVALTELAVEHKLPAAAVNKLVEQYARAEVAATKAMAAEQAAEIAKLGPQAEVRIAAYKAALTKHAGPKAQSLIDAVATADAVEAVEALVQALTGPAIVVPPAVVPPNKFEGLHGADLLTAARAAQA